MRLTKSWLQKLWKKKSMKILLRCWLNGSCKTNKRKGPFWKIRSLAFIRILISEKKTLPPDIWFCRWSLFLFISILCFKIDNLSLRKGAPFLQKFLAKKYTTKLLLKSYSISSAFCRNTLKSSRRLPISFPGFYRKKVGTTDIFCEIGNLWWDSVKKFSEVAIFCSVQVKPKSFGK